MPFNDYNREGLSLIKQDTNGDELNKVVISQENNNATLTTTHKFTIQSNALNTNSVNTNSIDLNEYNSDPAVLKSSIRANTDGEIYFTNDKFKVANADITAQLKLSGNSPEITTDSLNFTLPSSSGTFITQSSNDTLSNKILTDAVLENGVSGSAILDEDDMATGSNTKLATQRSIKTYVDSVASGLDIKKSVRVATTTSGTFATSFAPDQTIDGITLTSGNRILLKDQTTASENGIYTVNPSGAPTRSSDANNSEDVTAGMFMFVEEGAINGDKGFVLTTNDTITLGTTDLSFTQFSGAGQITAGTGLTKTGNALNVDASQTHVTAVGTLTSGTWQADAIEVAHGGTGLTTYTAGDLIYSDATNSLAKLEIGTTGEVLKVSSGGIIEWADNTEYTAQTPIVLSGTEFQLGTVPTGKGGTGITSYSGGDLIYGANVPGISPNDLLTLSIGSTGQVLQVSSGGEPEWATFSGSEWTLDTTNDLLYPNSTTTKVQIGTNTTANTFNLLNAGTTHSVGDITTDGTFTTNGNGGDIIATLGDLHAKGSSGKVIVGQSSKTSSGGNSYSALIKGDSYTNGSSYIEDGGDHAIRIIRAGYTGISWYNTEANARSNNNRAGYIQCDTSNKDMYINGERNTIISAGTGTVSCLDYFGIGTTNPTFPLQVSNTASSGSSTFKYAVLNGSSGGWSGGSNTTSFAVAAYFAGNIWVNNYVFTSSDRRIKTNIEDVEGKTALEQISQIPCRYYEYIDQKYPIGKCGEKHIGFVAQEVEEIMPMAVCNCNKNVIPNVYKNINCEWNGNIMSSTDLETVAGVKYQFFVSNLEDCSDEEMVELVGNEDNTFTFEKKYNNVFCYGYEVDDFNTVDYNKIYTLNVSATQELIKENELLKQELNTHKAIIDKLVNATSFDDFKASLA